MAANLDTGIKSISFSLWGNISKYTIGAKRNAELAKKLYPGWECWFYIHTSVPPEIAIDLASYSNVKIIHVSGDLNLSKPMMWRFASIDDPNVLINISRDTDSRISLREVEAVNEWLESGKTFHIMRDHPDHQSLIQGGMFGTRKTSLIPNWGIEMDKLTQIGDKHYDQTWLANIIYPLIKHDCFIHDEYIKFEGDKCSKFPRPLDNTFAFVGEYIDEYENQSYSHKIHLIGWLEEHKRLN